MSKFCKQITHENVVFSAKIETWVTSGWILGGFGVDFRIVLPWSILTVLAILGNFGTFLLKVMLAGEDFSKRLLNDPSEIAERSRDHSRDTFRHYNLSIELDSPQNGHFSISECLESVSAL